MAPFKSSLARSAGKLLGVFRETDLSLRGATQLGRHTIPIIPIVASGGNIANGVAPGNGYKYHVFTTSGALTISSGNKSIEYLVVGGGGAGGATGGAAHGGGGAGGLRSGSISAAGVPISVTVGSGGNYPGNNGGHSIFGSIRSEGGGRGGDPSSSPGTAGYNGGSGGGGSGSSTVGGTGNREAGTTTVVPSQGNNGGGASGAVTSEGGGGGGGAGAAGDVGANTFGGDGGPGLAIPAYAAPLSAFNPMPSDWKTAVGPTGLYAGGGGGGAIRNPTGFGAPGPGGGGSGGATNPSLGNAVSATAGIDFTGGGGGGSAYNPNPDSQPGGDGIVIIRYAV
jgi:hypothetical protein